MPLAASVLDNQTIAFIDFAEGGKYLQLNPGAGINSTRPTGDVINDSAQFQVEVSRDGPWEGAHYVCLEASNDKY